jgi:hypothetical protein
MNNGNCSRSRVTTLYTYDDFPNIVYIIFVLWSQTYEDQKRYSGPDPEVTHGIGRYTGWSC